MILSPVRVGGEGEVRTGPTFPFFGVSILVRASLVCASSRSRLGMAGGGLSFAFFPFFLPSPFTFGVLGGLGGLGGFGGLDGLSCLGVFTVLGVFFFGIFSTGGGGEETWTGDGGSSLSPGHSSSAGGLALVSALLAFEAFWGAAQSTAGSDTPVPYVTFTP